MIATRQAQAHALLLRGIGQIKEKIMNKRENIAYLLGDGMLSCDIARTLHVSSNTVAAVADALGIKLMKGGKGPRAAKEKKRQKPQVLSHDEVAERIAEITGGAFEYINGYTSCDGFVRIRCIKCGTISRKSMVAIRHNKNTRCQHCYELELAEQRNARKQGEARKREAKEILKRITKPQKHKQLTVKECPACGALFVGVNKYCSKKCSQSVANHRDDMKHRARAEAAWTEESKTINLRQLYKRDGGICWICGGVCDINADPNSNWYPSKDHIVPISKGGKDTWSNLRLAHRWCNSVRKNNTNIDKVRSLLIPSGFDENFGGPWRTEQQGKIGQKFARVVGLSYD